MGYNLLGYGFGSTFFYPSVDIRQAADHGIGAAKDIENESVSGVKKRLQLLELESSGGAYQTITLTLLDSYFQ